MQPFTKEDFFYPAKSDWDEAAVAALFARLQDPHPIFEAYKEVILPFAATAPSISQILLSPVGVREGYNLHQHIQMFLFTLESCFVPTILRQYCEEVVFLLRLYAMLHDGGKVKCYLDTGEVALQAVYNTEFLQQILYPAISLMDGVSIRFTERIRKALLELAGQDILGKSVQHYTRPKTRGTGRSMSPDEAAIALSSFAASFQPSFRRALKAILPALYTSDVRSYTTHVGFTNDSGVWVPSAPGTLDSIFIDDSLKLANPEAQATLASLLASL